MVVLGLSKGSEATFAQCCYVFEPGYFDGKARRGQHQKPTFFTSPHRFKKVTYIPVYSICNSCSYFVFVSLSLKKLLVERR